VTAVRRRRLTLAAVALVACVALAACSSSGKTSSSTTTNAGKTYSLSTSKGQVSLSLDGHLPEHWPSGFPLPDGAKAAGSGALQGGSEGVIVGVFTTSGSAQDAYDFYRTNRDLKIDDTKSAGGSNAFVGTVDFSGAYSGVVTAGNLGSTEGFVVILESGTSTGTEQSSSSTAA
jgi:hypothetical protein